MFVRSPQTGQNKSLQGQIMGTYWIVKTNSNNEELHQKIQQELDNINQKMSTYIDDSEVSRFNQHKEKTLFSLSKETIEVISYLG